MADLFYSLSNSILPRLGQAAALEGGIRTWLIKGPYSVDPVSTDSRIELEVLDRTSFTNFLAFDFERFALSSWESFLVSRLESEKYGLAGWPLLKLYYSAFFSAHAIMRSQGFGVVKIEKPQSQYLNSVVQIMTGTPPKIQPGMFEVSLDLRKNGNVFVVFERQSKAGGVHDGFWNRFITFLEMISMNATKIGAVDAGLFVAGVGELKEALKRDSGSGASSFSTVRNEINYQHKHGVWFPKKSQKPGNVFDHVKFAPSDSIRFDLSRKNSPIPSFINTARYLACLNKELSEYVAADSSLPIAFGAKWRRLNKSVI